MGVASRQSNNINIKEGELIDGKFLIGQLLGKGSFGKVYDAIEVATQAMVAVKFGVSGSLEIEERIYRQLKGITGIPELRWFGKLELHESTPVNVLVLDRLGPSLEEVMKEKKEMNLSLSAHTTFMIAVQVLEILRKIHTFYETGGFIHRDIKPDNILLGRKGTPDGKKIFLVDFGLAKLKDFETQPYWKDAPKSGSQLTGTACYASINSHDGLELCQRDDLESLAYFIVYLSTGRLPWQDITGEDKQDRYQKIGQMKKSISWPKLCNGLPGEMLKFLEHIRNLKYKQKPDYQHLHYLLTCMVRNSKKEKAPKS